MMMVPFSYKYGVPSRLGDDFYAKWPSIRATFSTQRELWNELVGIEAETREAWRAAVEDGAEELQALQAESETIQARIAAMEALPSASRDKAALKDLRTQVKALKAQAREARRVVAAARKPLLEALEAARREKVKNAIRAAGLWWCQSEAILERYDVARVRAMKTGVHLHDKAEHQFGGVLRVRWQNGLPVPKLLDDSDTLAGITITDARRGHAVLRICIDSHFRDKTYVTVPFVMHRPLPEGAAVRSVALYPQKRGAVTRWHVAIVVQQPDLAAGNNQSDTLVLTQDWLKDDDAWTARMKHAGHLQHVLDQKAAAVFEQLLTASDISDEDRVAVIEYLARTQGRTTHGWLRRLVGRVEVVSEFWHTTERMRLEKTNLISRAVRSRKEYYRNLAADLCRTHRRLDVERGKMWFAKVGPDRPAWGEFCEILKMAGRRHGCEVNFFEPEQEKEAA